MLNATKPLNCIFFVSFCCKFFFFIPNQPFVVFTEDTMKAAWLERGAVQKIPEKNDKQTAFWYDWTCIFLLIRCSLWARYTADERWSFDSDEPKFSFLWISTWSTWSDWCSSGWVLLLYGFGLHSFTCQLCLSPLQPKQFELYCQPNRHSKERLRPLWPSTRGRYVRAIHREKWIWFY